MGGGPLLPMAGYRERRLRIEQSEADGGQMRDLILRRATYIPVLRYNLISVVNVPVTFKHIRCSYNPASLLLGARTTTDLRVLDSSSVFV